MQIKQLLLLLINLDSESMKVELLRQANIKRSRTWYGKNVSPTLKELSFEDIKRNIPKRRESSQREIMANC